MTFISHFFTALTMRQWSTTLFTSSRV